MPIGSEVPLGKKSSFPPGEAKGEVAGAGTIQFTYLLPICSGNSGELRAPIIYKLVTHAIVLIKIHVFHSFT